MSMRKRQVSFKVEDEAGGAGASSSSPSPASTKPSSDDAIDLKPKAVNALSTGLRKKQTSLDYLFQCYSHFITSAGNSDKILKILQYSLWFLGRMYGSRASQKAIQKVSGEISWARYVNRLLGWPAAIQWAKDPKQKWLGKLLAWTMVLYYPLEHLAYIEFQAPGSLVNAKRYPRFASLASAWSCRFWLAYIVLDMVRSVKVLKDDTTSSETVKNERLQLVRNACFSLPGLHWSLPNWDVDPWLPDTFVNGLMWLESVVCLYQGIGTTSFPPKEEAITVEEEAITAEEEAST